MEGVPTRKESLSSNSMVNLFLRQRSVLETLRSMGFPTARAEKAIASSGNRSVNLASNWLLSHANDPNVEKTIDREYIIYLCPMWELKEQLDKFWKASFTQCGWNAAHLNFPHITLCSFFRMADCKIDTIEKVMQIASEVMNGAPVMSENLSLDLSTENNAYIGFFVTRQIRTFFEDLMDKMQEEFRKNGVEMSPQKKQLHLTLAFQYDRKHHNTLCQLAKEIQVPKNARWEIKIFSRDYTHKNSEVRKIIKHYQPEQLDELELFMEDFVYMDPEERDRSMDGWFKGTSFQTGLSGFFPGNFTQRCSQMEIWTFHRAVPLKKKTVADVPNYGQLLNGAAENSQAAAGATAALEPADSNYDNLWMTPSPAVMDPYATVKKIKGQMKQCPKPRKLMIIRHGQRCDFSYQNWYYRSFGHDGIYKRFDLNCPQNVPARNSYQDFYKDVPLTEIGKAQARITGEALKDSGMEIDFIYSSPALRCIQTSQEIMNGMKSKCKIRVEPGLFEWYGWLKGVRPTYMTVEELVNCGMPVDESYNSYMKSSQLDLNESVENYYNRSHNTTLSILKCHESGGGTILLLGHSGSINACTRQLRGKSAHKSEEQMRDLVRGCPYCFVALAEEDPVSFQWSLVEPPVPLLTHGANKEYDWKRLVD